MKFSFLLFALAFGTVVLNGVIVLRSLAVPCAYPDPLVLGAANAPDSPPGGAPSGLRALAILICPKPCTFEPTFASVSAPLIKSAFISGPEGFGKFFHLARA